MDSPYGVHDLHTAPRGCASGLTRCPPATPVDSLPKKFMSFLEEEREAIGTRARRATALRVVLFLQLNLLGLDRRPRAEISQIFLQPPKQAFDLRRLCLLIPQKRPGIEHEPGVSRFKGNSFDKRFVCQVREIPYKCREKARPLPFLELKRVVFEPEQLPSQKLPSNLFQIQIFEPGVVGVIPRIKRDDCCH